MVLIVVDRIAKRNLDLGFSIVTEHYEAIPVITVGVKVTP